jgi:hypothetical protein
MTRSRLLETTSAKELMEMKVLRQIQGEEHRAAMDAAKSKKK